MRDSSALACAYLYGEFKMMAQCTPESRGGGGGGVAIQLSFISQSRQSVPFHSTAAATAHYEFLPRNERDVDWFMYIGKGETGHFHGGFVFPSLINYGSKKLRIVAF